MVVRDTGAVAPSPLDRVREARTDEDELAAVIDALADADVSLHQLAGALGLPVHELAPWFASRAQTVAAPASLNTGDIITRTRSASAPTAIRIERPYRRPAGADAYSAEVSIRGRVHQVDATVITRWFPVDVLRAPRA